jgi:hypothetical protein
MPSTPKSAFPRGLQQFAQTPRGRVAIELARGNIEHELLPLIGRQLPFSSNPLLSRKTRQAASAVRLLPSMKT